VTRLQRASQGAGQSAGRGGYQVIERRRTLDVSSARDAVVIGDLVVDPEFDRLGSRRDEGPAERSDHDLDSHPRRVSDLAHFGGG